MNSNDFSYVYLVFCAIPFENKSDQLLVVVCKGVLVIWISYPDSTIPVTTRFLLNALPHGVNYLLQGFFLLKPFAYLLLHSCGKFIGEWLINNRKVSLSQIKGKCELLMRFKFLLHRQELCFKECLVCFIFGFEVFNLRQLSILWWLTLQISWC